MDDDSGFPDDHVAELTRRLHSRLGWVRHPAVEELADVDFEPFEQPPRLALLAAMNAPELRDRARDSLARVLRAMEPDDLRQIGPEERRILRASIKWSRPQAHADYLVEVAQMLLRLGDTDAIHVLDNLVERSTIRQYMVEEYHKGQGTTRRVERSFRGSHAEEREVRRVRSAAHVACERLRLLGKKLAPGGTLLHPASAPESEELLRPAGNPAVDPSHLLHPSPDHPNPG